MAISDRREVITEKFVGWAKAGEIRWMRQRNMFGGRGNVGFLGLDRISAMGDQTIILGKRRIERIRVALNEAARTPGPASVGEREEGG